MLQEKLVDIKQANHSIELEKAFNNFNEASNHLTHVYMDLERQVATLSSELVSVNDKRAQEYEEKERIAKRLQNLLQVMPAGIVVLDNNGTVIEHNPAATGLLGEPLLGEAWCNIVDRSFSPRWDDGHDITLVDDRCVNISTQSLDSESGQLVLIKETTETKRLQLQLDRLKRLSAMGDMASSMAHQIRTPLSTALLYASHLRNNNLDIDLRGRFVHKLINRLQHLESLVEDMLLFARGGKFDSSPVSITDFVSELTESIEPQLQQAQAKLVLNNSAGEARIDINRNTFISTLHNLVNNSIHASKYPITMTIDIRVLHGDSVEIGITDDGPGIDPAIQDKIFEPFFTTRGEGTGLGLTVADAVIRAHGGQIKLESAHGRGATFRVTLPIAA